MERRDAENAEKKRNSSVFLCNANVRFLGAPRRFFRRLRPPPRSSDPVAGETGWGTRLVARRALILPVVLLILALLGLLSASFAFQVNADYAATQALVDKMQTRLAAEAGFHYVTLLLRDRPYDVDTWYNNEEKMRRVLVWSAAGGLSTFGAVEESDSETEEESYEPAYRFSIVADDPSDDEVKVRWGITDESAKLNINTATADQLTRLIVQVVPPETPVKPLVDSLLDWRDGDDRVSSNGAESDYYRTLAVPYRCKNAPFDTVEELLMVHGFNGQILYGEDADRNGLLSLNEDDGETTFPPDNEDGALNRGLYPYITVHSRDYNRANDNKPRVPLSSGGEDARARLEELSTPDGERVFTAQEVDYLLSSGDDGEASKDESPEKGDEAKPKTKSLADFVVSDPSSPFALDDFARIVNYCTLNPSPELPGLVNINTAPSIVLRCLGGLSEEEVNAIVQKRATLSADTKATTAWLLTQGVLNQEKYDAVANLVTARGLQFTVEVVGYGDHIGSRTRLQIIFELRGPVPQIVYYRDLTTLGVTYPLRREEEEQWSQSSDGLG